MTMAAKVHMGEERAGEAEELVSTSMGEARMMTIIYLFEWTLAHMVMAELEMFLISYLISSCPACCGTPELYWTAGPPGPPGECE